MKPNLKIILILGLITILGLSACNVSLAEDITPPPGSEIEPPIAKAELIEGVFPLSDPNAETGKAIYITKCAPCHGDLGLADGPDAALLSVPVPAIGSFEVSLMATPQEWFSMITIGNLESFMPPFSGSLDEQDRWDVLAYIYSLSLDETFLTAGQAVFQENCSTCHGDEGRGDGPDSEDAADLTDQERMVEVAGLNIVQMIAPTMGPEWHTIEGLSMDQYFSVAAYVRSLTFTPLFEGIATDVVDEPAVEEPAVEEPAVEEPAVDEPVVEEPVDENIIETISISGVVTFGVDGELPENLTVELLGFDHFEQNFSITVELGENGSFIFENIEVLEGMVVFASIDYEGATYGSDFVEMVPGMEDAEITVNIYDTTHDITGLSADRMHVFFIFDAPDIVQVVQIWLISNTSDQTVTPISETEPVLLFDVPEGAVNLLFENAELGAGRYVATEDGFGDLQPILPGQGVTQIVYAYELPYDKKLTLSQTLNIQVDEIVMFIPSNDIKLEAENMLELGIEELNGLSFRSYSIRNVTDSFEIELKGSHPSNPSGFSLVADNQNLLIGIGGLLIVVIGVVIWLRNSSSQDKYDYEDIQIEASAEILDEIITLDETYEDGKIESEEYQTKRQLLKDKLQAALDEEN